MEQFNLWSDLDISALEELKPNLGLRKWSELVEFDKFKVWKNLSEFFFDNDKVQKAYQPYIISAFGGEAIEKYQNAECVEEAIQNLNQKYKVKSFAKVYFEVPHLRSACADFFYIFHKGTDNLFLELLSLYCDSMLRNQAKQIPERYSTESEENFDDRYQKQRWQRFDQFAIKLNDIINDFGVDIFLSRAGFVFKQDEKIIKNIYEPTLKFLSSSKWLEVDLHFRDSFYQYRLNTPQGFSNSITNTVSALQAFLQILVYGTTGSGDFATLISEAQKNKLIADDFFSKTALKNIISALMEERQETGIAHPKKEYADEKNARFILNLSMVFIQHCIIN